MAAVLNLDLDCVTRLEQYEDDSVRAWFTDGTSISLAACGSAFTRQEKPKSETDPFGHVHSGSTTTVYQFTAYAAKECRERVCLLLAFRNLFAERPFLSPSLLSNEIKVSDHVIEYGVWPSTLLQANRFNLFQTSSEGHTRLLSSDGCAWVELANHCETLTTCYLARVPSSDVRTSDSYLRETEDGVKCSKGSYRYVWRKEVHSTQSTPREWKHPLLLLHQHRSHDSHMTTATDSIGSHMTEGAAADKENERVDSVVSVPLPPTLPPSCPNLHLHNQQKTLRVKVLFTEGILYRVFFDRPKPFVEALPNQNTVLRSHDLEGRFFHCWTHDDTSGRVQQSMYCVDHTPILSGLRPFSVARVIDLGSRLLDQALKLGKQDVKLCWKAPPTAPPPNYSSLQYTVPGLGRFTVRENGHVRCVFADRTIVDFYNPRTQPRNVADSHSVVCGVSVGRGGGVEVERGVWVDGHWCRLLQPNGRYLVLSTQHPISHLWYVEVMREFCEWFAQPEDIRGHFQQRTIHDQHSQRAVLAELSKIERFNAITTNTLPDSVANWGCGQLIGGRGELIDGCGQPEVPLFVRDALKQTENVVHDIDAILEK